MSDAEVLRKAVRLMRERAEAATPGPWSVGEITGPYPEERIPAHTDIEPLVAGGIDVPDAQHIASWHPAVADAVAYWLEYVADQGDRAAINHRARARLVARAYLGSDE